VGLGEPATSATGGSAATQAVDADARRWHTRKAASFAIRAAAFLGPFVASLLVARMLQELLPVAHRLPTHAVRWGVVIAGSSVVLVVADRVTRNLLPVAALFKVALVFPDRAPSRYKVALRSGSSAALAAKVRSGGGLGDTPAEAAENALLLLKDLAKHDRLTRGHSERVRAYAEVIADEMDLPAADKEKLRWAALVHDVGKMAVSPAILNKAGRPTDEEWRELRNHPAAAARMLAPLEPWLGEWLRAATEHHERVDGKGYPNGLRGDEISLAGRIVAVADAYDCMTSARSYKKALPPAQARFELSRNAGSQFDADVVRAFLNVSVGRLHLAGGPLAWLSSIPGLRDVATGLSGAASATGGAVAATGFAVVAATTGTATLTGTDRVATERPAAVASAPPSTTASVEGSESSAGPTDEDATTTSSTSTTTTTTTKPGTARAPTTTRPQAEGSAPTTTAPITRSTAPPTTRAPTTTAPPTTVDPSPIVVSDTISVKSEAHGDADVLHNDSDPNGDLNPDSLAIVSGPAFGSAELHGNGRIRYFAPTVTDSAQKTSLQYRVCDRAGHCATGTLSIVVTPKQ
jgi:putative nucleotidyltransferase with HDIG domain